MPHKTGLTVFEKKKKFVYFRISLGNGYSEENWHKLRSLLVEMRDVDTDTAADRGTSALSAQQLQYLKHSGALQVYRHYYKTIFISYTVLTLDSHISLWH